MAEYFQVNNLKKQTPINNYVMDNRVNNNIAVVL